MLEIFLSALVLFFILSPGILGKFPPKGNKFVVAIVHALVFSILFSLVIKGSKLIEGITIAPIVKPYFYNINNNSAQVLSEYYGGTYPYVSNVVIKEPLTISGLDVVTNPKTVKNTLSKYPPTYPTLICDGTTITINTNIQDGFSFVIQNGGIIIVESSVLKITGVVAGKGGGILKIMNPSKTLVPYVFNEGKGNEIKLYSNDKPIDTYLSYNGIYLNPISQTLVAGRKSPNQQF